MMARVRYSKLLLSENQNLSCGLKVQVDFYQHNIQTPYLSALDFCNSPVWNIKFDVMDFQKIENKLMKAVKKLLSTNVLQLY